MSRALVATSLAQVTTRRIEWIYQDRIPLRTGTILAGMGGIAKSTIVSDIIARATRGELPGTFTGTPITVGIISPEDDDESVLVPRLIAAEANLEKIINLSRVVVDESGHSWSTLPNIQDDLQSLGSAIREHGIKLLVVDPLVSIMVGNSISQSDVRRNFDPLSSLAAELEFALLAVAHFGKSGERAGDRLSGSHAFRDIARSLIVVAVDEETNDRVLTVEKSNYSPVQPSDAYSIESVAVQLDDGYEQVIGRATLQGLSAVTVQDIMDRSQDTTGLSNDMQTIISYVEQHTDGVTTQEAVKALAPGVSEASIRKGLSRAADRGFIERRARGVFASLSHVSTVPTVPKEDSKDTKDIIYVQDKCPKHDPPTTAPLYKPTEPTEPVKPTGAKGVQQADTVCPKHGTPTHQGMCGRCAAEKVSA